METRETVVHPSAVVLPGSELGLGVEVGPYAVIEPGVEVGDGCRIGPFVHLLGRTRIGAGTVVGSGSALGGEPQDKAYRGERTSVEIGSGCRFHENVTVHRATGAGVTRIGDGVMLMAGAHVGHNAVVEDEAVFVNGAAVGGHTHVGKRAMLSAYSSVHQFGRVGRLTLVGGGCMLTRDAPPFSIVAGSYPPIWRGPNTVGLKRAGFDDATRAELRRALVAILKGPHGPRTAASAYADDPCPEVRELARFVLAGDRAVCTAPRKP